MANQSQDICALTPDYPSPEMNPPSDVHLQATPAATLQCPFISTGGYSEICQQHGYEYLIRFETHTPIIPNLLPIYESFMNILINIYVLVFVPPRAR